MARKRLDYRSETAEWARRGELRIQPFGIARYRCGLELITATFPDTAAGNAADDAAAITCGTGELRVKLVNQTHRDLPNVSVQSRLQEGLVTWLDHRVDDRVMLHPPVLVPGAPRSAAIMEEAGFSARFQVDKPGLETIVSEALIDGLTAGLSARSEVRVELVQGPTTKPGNGGRPGQPKGSRTAPRVLVSYARADSHWRDRFLTMLTPAQRAHALDVWSDLAVEPGDLWHRSILAAIDACDAALLLVTSAYLHSPYINDVELGQLLAKKKRLCWVAVDRSLYDFTPLGEVQCLNDPKRPIASFSKTAWDQQVGDACAALLRAIRAP